MTELIKNSVTADDYIEAKPTEGMPFSILIGPASFGAMLGSSGLLSGIKGSSGLPNRGTFGRDAILSESPHLDNMWAGAISLAISKQVALGFTLDDAADKERRLNRSQDLLLAMGGAWHVGLSKHLRDYLLTDNGAYLEIVRASSAAGSRILGVMPLDSLRCYPTDNPNYPVVYMDRRGAYHWLRADDVIRITDMPSPRVEDLGYGMCAGSRAWETVLKLTAMETYFREKVSGQRNLAIHIVNGISDKQLGDALYSGDVGNQARGFTLYRGSTIIPMLTGQAPSIITIPLAEVPDGFNVDSERKDAYLRIANALGVPVQDIQPLSGQGLGTGTQSVVLQEAAQGQGLAAWRTAFAREITHRVLPNTVTFSWATNDTREQKAAEEVKTARATTMKTLVEAGIINTGQALNVLVDAGDLPREFLGQDMTAAGSVSDQDKVLTADEQIEANAATPGPLAPTVAPVPVTKAGRLLAPGAMIVTDDVIAAANKLRREVAV